MTPSPTQLDSSEDRPSSLFPRIALAIFALGSVTLVIGIATISQLSVREFDQKLRQELTQVPVVSEYLGELKEIRFDRTESRRLARDTSLAFAIQGTLARGVVTVEVKEVGRKTEILHLLELRVEGGPTISLVEADRSNSEALPTSDE